MTTSTQMPQLQRVVVLQPVRYHLVFAQQRLLDRTIPFQLRAQSYLRICCSAIKTYQRLCLYSAAAPNSNTPYLTLLGQLVDYNPKWWQACHIDSIGYLVSNDPIIDQWLQPLNLFAAQILKSQAA